MDRYITVDGEVINSLGPLFDSVGEAEDFADDNNIEGVLMLQSVYITTPEYFIRRLAQLKGILTVALRAEGDRRCKLVNEVYSIDAAFALFIGGDTSGIGAIAQTVDNTVATINALGDVPAADSYDVITDPAW